MRGIWNEDGTPKLPTPGSSSVQAFADLAGNSEGKLEFVSYAALQREAKAATPAGVGDVVHYWDDGECYAALCIRDGLTAEHEDTLFVFDDRPNARMSDAHVTAHHNERKAEGTWHWPESL